MSEELSLTWADRYDYPFDDGWDLSNVMQYAFVIERDPVTVKERVTAQLRGIGAPDFTDPTEPHALLARHPMRVYLTTNYDDYMTQALRAEGREPMTAVCPWYRDSHVTPTPTLPRGYQPNSQTPLVYHLHGSFEDPASLVIGQQDYLEFLIKLAMDRGMNDQRVVPVQLLQALTRQPLLFIGYSLRDWTFRLLFHGLVHPVANVRRRRHVSVQLSPALDGADADTERRAQEYLTSYFEFLNISVYWGTAREFCTELAHWLEDPDGQA